ncbi:conserved hypothetical protein [Gloeothece citriformis PCC 7424]|uniref:peptidylprolyl isomerase n=1 Tax=Gloeothece citriformis (strain PCC 7424) TaxID=65393 RepID=B7KC55_GLOC7|nr:peptidylprolyl isomerase [Gloeothece citriformis]ACK68878.1 conserved hypothetical protein [Gloeothece citriformis PCC 7424]
MVQTVKITEEEILKQVKLSSMMTDVVKDIVNRKIIEDETQKLGITVDEKELQQAADKLRLMYQLYKAEDTWKWLKENHLTVDDFEEIVFNKALSSKLAVHLFNDKIEPYYYEHQLDYTGVIMYEVILNDEELALELFYALQEGEITFSEIAHQYIEDTELRRKGGYRGLVYRKDLKPEISATVFAAKPPQVIKPIVTSKGVHLILVEEIIQRQLDNPLRHIIANSLFNEWLEKHTQQVEII